MHNLETRRERFLRDDSPRRLGAIAANLARVSSFAPNPANRQAVFDLLEESKWFIEWAVPAMDVSSAARLVEIQVSLSQLESSLRRGTLDTASLADHSAAWRDEVLSMSGLLA